VLGRCQKEISLEEMDIPPIGLRKTRRGGMLIEVRCENQDGNLEEEKAEQLAGRIKEVVGSKEGAVVRCLLLRLRLKLTGLSLGAAASEIAEAVVKVGGGRTDKIKVGPLRTLASGVGTTWVECPKRVALQAAGLTLGWVRVGVILEDRGAPPVPPLSGAWAPQAVVPLSN